MANPHLPAVLGGVPVRPQGPPPWPLADEEVREALLAAFQDGSWGKYRGNYLDKLEAALRAYLGVEFVLTCGSGTFAVELALRALKIGPGDEVILAGYDYPGNFYSIHAVGAMPVLSDLDAGNWNLAVESLEAAAGPKTKAIIVSHLHGGLVPMKEVMAFARRHGLGVIEDAAQVPGALVQGSKAGTWGDLGIWSFGGSKLLSAGRGGALFTARADLYQRARTCQVRAGNVVCPLSELQAAVLLPQLAGLDERNRQRQSRADFLSERLEGVAGLRPLRARSASEGVSVHRPVYYKLGFQYEETEFGLPRARFLEAMRAEGIALDEGFAALHLGRSPRRFRPGGDLREAERAHHGMLVLHHPVLLGSEEDILQIVCAVEKIRSHLDLLRREV